MVGKPLGYLVSTHGAAQPLTKLLKSAEANAVNNNVSETRYVAELYAMRDRPKASVRVPEDEQTYPQAHMPVDVVLKER